MIDDLISLDRIYQYIEDTFALEGEDAKKLIESFIDYSEAGLAACDSTGGRQEALLPIAATLKETPAGIGFWEFQQVAKKFEKAVQDNDENGREENYRLMVVLLSRLKNEFKA